MGDIIGILQTGGSPSCKFHAKYGLLEHINVANGIQYPTIDLLNFHQ